MKFQKFCSFFLLLAFSLACASCSVNGEPKNNKTTEPQAAQTTKERRVKYITKDDAGITGFFSDGSVAAGKWRELNEATVEALCNEEPHETYRELADCLITGNGIEKKFSGENGAIASEWAMIDYIWVYSGQGVTNYAAYDGSLQIDGITHINETCLIEIMPEIKTFEDEESEEAAGYFSAMDDYAYYISETRSRFENAGIKSVVLKTRYLVLGLKGGSMIIIDTHAQQNGSAVNAFLYKQGKLPLVVDITDSNMEQYKDYLQN